MSCYIDVTFGSFLTKNWWMVFESVSDQMLKCLYMKQSSRHSGQSIELPIQESRAIADSASYHFEIVKTYTSNLWGLSG